MNWIYPVGLDYLTFTVTHERGRRIEVTARIRFQINYLRLINLSGILTIFYLDMLK